jgi:hypothetical protein
MIVGDGYLAAGARRHFPRPPFTWVCHDHAVELVGLPSDGLLVVSTPLPLDTITLLDQMYEFAYVPENVREAHPEDWKTQTRFVIGTRHDHLADMLREWFAPTPCIVMSPESAGLVKHAINTYLALCVEYGVELGRICTKHGILPSPVIDALLTERRIHPDTPLLPGHRPAAHLTREVRRLFDLGGGPLIDTLEDLCE